MRIPWPFRRKEGAVEIAGKREQLRMREYDYRLGHEPPIDFNTLYDIYTRDVDVYSAVNALAYMAVGVGVYVESDDEKAKQIIDEFNEQIHLDEILFTIVSEMIWGGNSFWYKVRNGRQIIALQHLPLTRIKKLKATEDGKPKTLVMMSGGQYINVPFDDLLHFYLMKVDKELFGSPLIRPIAEQRYDSDGNALTPLYLVKWMLEDYMFKVIRKYPPRYHYKFDVDQEKLTEFKNAIANLKPGEDLVTNVDFEVKSLSSDPRSRFTDFFKHLDNKVVIGLMTVTHRLFTTPGFTEASANVAMDLQQLIIKGIQRKIKRVLEGLYREVLDYHGIDARVRLNFGEPQVPELEYDHIHDFTELGVISYDEARKILADKGWPLEVGEEEAEEALRPRHKWADTPKQVILTLIDPADIDKSTIRYYPLDADLGVRMAVAWVKSDKRRLPVAIFFDKGKWDWNLDEARRWYRDAFPTVYWERFVKVGRKRGDKN